MENNSQQLEVLAALGKLIDESNAASIKLAKENPNSSLPQKQQEEQKNFYINTMTDVIIHNPYIWVKTISNKDDAPLYHNVEKGKNGTEYHSLTVFTEAAELNPEEHYRVMPFNEMMQLVVDDPQLFGAIINPTEEAKYILLNDTMQFLLNFTNISFIGF